MFDISKQLMQSNSVNEIEGNRKDRHIVHSYTYNEDVVNSDRESRIE